MITKELFCKALRMIVEQEEINRQFSVALQAVGNGHYVFGTPNKYYDALLEVLKETVGDKYDYISWWLDKDAVFDTNRKSLLRRISAEKGLK